MYYVSPLNGVTPRINKFQLLELTTTATFSNYQVGWSSKWSFDSRLIHLFLSSLYIYIMTMNSAGKPQFFGHRVIHHIH